MDFPMLKANPRLTLMRGGIRSQDTSSLFDPVEELRLLWPLWHHATITAMEEIG